MTALEMATEFLSNMTKDNTIDFRIYEFPLPDKTYHLEVCFSDEGTDEIDTELKVCIDLVEHGHTFDHTFANTYTQTIADGIDYLLQKWEVLA